jgi:hypothetical protein
MDGQEERMSEFLLRMWGAATLETATYEDVEADPQATLQALVVIVVASLAAGFGASGWNARPEDVLRYSAVAACLALLSWAGWAVLTFEIGSQLLPERQTRVTVGELLRTTGFSTAPAVFLVLGAFGDTTIVFALVALWMLATMVVAIRQALDYTSTARALAVCGLGWLMSLIFIVILGIFFGPALGA